MSKHIIAKNLEFLGRQYEKAHLERWKNNNLNSNAWEALKFFFSHSFMRGRRDELSVEYYEFTMNVLSESFDKTNLYKFFYGLVKKDKMDIAYSELNKLYGVGDKIATFFLRDTVIMNNYDIAVNNMKYVFPVDTWVAQITGLLADKKFSVDTEIIEIS
ncbi:MAG: hypothetical protein ACLFT6_03085 [Bacteroidales bacterium]